LKTAHSLSIALLVLATILTSRAGEINIIDHSLTPDGSGIVSDQQTDIKTPNGGVAVLPNTNGLDPVYAVTTFTFGTGSLAHIDSFFEFTGGQDRLGVRVEDTGLVTFLNQGDPGDTSFTIAGGGAAGFMAGQSVTLLIKQHYDTSNDSLRATQGTGDDNLMNIWVNPTGASVEGSGLSAGDMHTLWNSYGYGFYTQRIRNENTPGTAGQSSITDTVILTGTDATFANALALATGSTPPTGIVDAGTSIVRASPTAVPADGTTTSTVTITLKEAGGNPVSGKEVSLSGNGSATITTGNNTSDANGVVTFTVKSSSAGSEVFTATDVTDSNLVITETAIVDFQVVVPVGPVDANTSTVANSSNSVLANDVSTSTITVALKDSNGLPVSGEDVSLVGSPSNATISPSTTQTTDGNGEAVFNVSSNTIGTVIFTATSSTDNVTITQTASVDFTDPQGAESFNVNFLDDGQTDETSLIGVVGAVGETWNQGITSVSNLVDTTGTVTTAVSVSGLSSSGRPISGSSLDVFKANRDVFDKGGNYDFSITGLTPGAAYDLYIYALSHNTSSWEDISNSERAAGEFVTPNTVLGNGQSQWLDNAVTSTSGNAFVPNGNYVEFQSIVADGSGSVTITVDAYDGIDGNPSTDDGDTRLHVCGLQIRPATGMSVDYMKWRSAYYLSLGLPDEDDEMMA